MAEPFKKDGKWAFRCDIGPDPATGKRRQVLRQGFRTRKEAAAAQAEILGQARGGQVVARSNGTVREYLTQWLETQTVHVRATTLHGYQGAVNRILAKIGSAKLQSITVLQLDTLYAGLLQDGLSPKTIANTHNVLRRALSDAVRTGVLSSNPAASARTPRLRRNEMTTWSADQLRAFYEATADSRLHALWVTLGNTGMRRGEALGLRWSDVDLGTQELSIRQTRTTAGSTEVVGPTKTEKSRRTLALDDGTVAVLRAYRRVVAAERLRHGDAYDATHDLVFVDATGRPVSPDWATRTFRRLVQDAGLPAIRLHDLRHGWATRALERGVPARVVAEQLGHSTVVVSLDVYSHVTSTTLRDAVDRVAEGLHD